jgi:hypothetical protein
MDDLERWVMKTGGVGGNPVPEPASIIGTLLGIGLAIKRKFRK